MLRSESGTVLASGSASYLPKALVSILVALQAAEKGKAVASSDSFYTADASDPVTDWQDYGNFYDEYDDDEEVLHLKQAQLNVSCILGKKEENDAATLYNTWALSAISYQIV